MNWKILALLTVALLVFVACGAPAPTMDGEQSTAETENVADAAEAADQTEGAEAAELAGLSIWKRLALRLRPTTSTTLQL